MPHQVWVVLVDQAPQTAYQAQQQCMVQVVAVALLQALPAQAVLVLVPAQQVVQVVQARPTAVQVAVVAGVLAQVAPVVVV
jgi:hypothetical protein